VHLTLGVVRAKGQSPGRSALAAVALLALAACVHNKPAPPPPAPPVTIALARVETVPVDLRAIGAVEPSATVSVRSRVTGQLTRVGFTEGQDVGEGDVLFTIDRRPFVAALAQARANLARDEAQAAQAAVSARRYGLLAAPGVTSREQAEQAEATARALAATVEADRAAVSAAALNLGYCTVRSPIAGKTGSLKVREGNVVTADTTVLVVVNRLAPSFVTIAVSEGSLGELRRQLAGGPLAMTAAAPGDPGPPARGTVTFLDNEVDRATGTIRVRGTFPNADARLWPGQFVQGVVTLSEKPDAVVVPAAAVQEGQSGAYVFVVGADLHAEERPVTPGIRLSDRRVVIDEGLEGGERVVTAGQIRLVPGAPVSITGTTDEAPREAP
jgi:multidrug efflux system membrane fusion protein